MLSFMEIFSLGKYFAVRDNHPASQGYSRYSAPASSVARQDAARAAAPTPSRVATPRCSSTIHFWCCAQVLGRPFPSAMSWQTSRVRA
eukprot:2594086-Pleurochrysis_carterae.AAC.1